VSVLRFHGSPLPAGRVNLRPIPALPFCHAELRASKPKHAHYPKEINTLSDHILKRRLNLSLLQREVADQIGVDETTITHWERNATTPPIRYIRQSSSSWVTILCRPPTHFLNALPPRGRRSACRNERRPRS